MGWSGGLARLGCAEGLLEGGVDFAARTVSDAAQRGFLGAGAFLDD